MSHVNHQTNLARVTVSRRQGHAPWFWFTLTGGSILLHLVLIYLVEGSSYRSLLQNASEATVPIDFVELPVSEPRSTTESASLPTAAPIAQTDFSQTAETDLAANSANTHLSANTDQIAVLRSPLDLEAGQMPDGARSMAAASPPADEPVDVPQPPPEAPAASVRESAVGNEPEQLPAPETTQLEAAPPEAKPARQFQAIQSATPAAPQVPEVEPRPILPLPSPWITTERIDVPVPDVTETLLSEAVQTADRTADRATEQLVTEQISVPSQLTASLTTALPASTDPPLDEVPYPKQEVQTFASNSASSPCVMTPEAVPFLGKTVAMEVMTDESGQVVDTVTQESSQSVAYDELATCLVKNWDFEPAIAQGEPIATDGLVVRITIEANEANG